MTGRYEAFLVMLLPCAKGQKTNSWKVTKCVAFPPSPFNVPFSENLIQYLFRVRASQNYHHPLCDVKIPDKEGTRDSRTRKKCTFYFITLNPVQKRWWNFNFSYLTHCHQNDLERLENHRNLFMSTTKTPTIATTTTTKWTETTPC